jgi:hypothetical protein
MIRLSRIVGRDGSAKRSGLWIDTPSSLSNRRAGRELGSFFSGFTAGKGAIIGVRRIATQKIAPNLRANLFGKIAFLGFSLEVHELLLKWSKLPGSPIPPGLQGTDAEAGASCCRCCSN